MPAEIYLKTVVSIDAELLFHYRIEQRLERPSIGNDDNGHIVILLDNEEAYFNNVKIGSISGTGTALIGYTSEKNKKLTDITLDNISVYGDFEKSINTNGINLVNAYRCIQHNIRASGIREFAVEYKNETRDSLLSNIIVQNSKVGILYGQDTTTTDDVSYCAASNGVLHGNDQGIVIGDAKYNVFSNFVINSEGRPEAPGTAGTGIRTSGDSKYNMFTNISLIGDNMIDCIRHNTEGNFVSAGLYTPQRLYVNLTAGAKKNVTEILHPGFKSTISDSISNASGQSTSGTDSNPTYCHATGEYIGILSPRWRFVHNEAPVSPMPEYKQVLEGIGSTFHSVMSDGTGLTGYAIRTPKITANFQVDSSGTYVRLGSLAWGVRSYETSFRAESDSTTLGNANICWSEVFAINDAINTSDESEKLIDDIPSEWLDAAEKIKQIRFKWLNEIERHESGLRQSARWHIGYGAQSVYQACIDAGIENPWELALLCKDSLEEELEDGTITPLIDEKTGKQKERWGLRVNELNTLKIASMERRYRST